MMSTNERSYRLPKLPTAAAMGRPQTPECDRKLKRLEQSGLLAKLANFQTKSIPLALEEEDEEEYEDNDDNKQQNLNEEVFIDISKTNDTIELKSTDEFEPPFVSQIRDEVRKISCSSMSSQSSQKTVNAKTVISKTVSAKTAVKKSLGEEEVKKERKSLTSRRSKSSIDRRSQSSTGRRSQSNPRSDPGVSKWQQKLQIPTHSSNVNTVNTSNKQKENIKQNQNQLTNDKKESVETSQKPSKDSNRETTIRKIKINNKYYQILNCIGQGGSSRVYQVYDPELQMTLAIKVVDLSRADSQTVSGYKNEITLLSKLRECKRVVRMYDYEYQNNGQQLLVVMEKGDSDLSYVLKSFIESEEKRSLDSHLIRFYWQQMLKAVDEIHSYGVVHSDLKPINFILVAGKLKLIDFGIANAIQGNLTSVYKESQIGTINYMAPEALQNRSKVKGKTVVKYNCKADIWSLGCILYNLVYGQTPYHHFDNLFQKANAILDPNHQINYPPIDDLLLLDVMQKCLRKDPNKRPTTTELLNHSYLKDSKASKASVISPNGLISQINNLTPNRIKQLSQVLEKLSKK